MADLFDKNGNATETHIVTVSGFNATTGEHISTYDVRILEGSGIPGFSTLTLSPSPEAGHVVCWDGSQWEQVIDLRGSTAYEKSNGEAVTVKTLGALNDKLTAVAPATSYDQWDGTAWITDIEAQNADSMINAELQRTLLLTAANTEIAWRQDAIDAEIAAEEEIAELAAWKKYRVLLMRVNTAAPVWPTIPGL